ncbi:TetR/AcrR family transcriptional regulator [Acaricomes phytoseiuli]|uniref:TetR/AcrR family transcriptional regulator n=1 Tax=Acaricomes phytoseiuli TaxID=291968 RepID=UPI00037BE658|nr:TetR/AcrR family transcriptional regulator [Acaricomes phytoseiuli]MCW1249355.1 TetR/AcrR family transcriptional regulator [Acaricomes phytoseiuli]
MPRIIASSNAEQRELTQRKVLDAFGELLFSHGLPGLTMTDVARRAGVGRTAVYNYFADLEQLLVAYALDETGRFLEGLKKELGRLNNPVDQLTCYVRAQIEDLSKRHVPPGPTIRSVLSAESFAKLSGHVGELSALLQDILERAMAEGYLPQTDVNQLAQLIHGSLTANISRSPQSEAVPELSAEQQEQIEATVRFIQAGAGARFDESGRPLFVHAADESIDGAA